MRRNRLIVGLLFLLGIVGSLRLWVQFGQPLFLRAQTTPPATETSSGPDNLGPHAAFFDEGGNARIAQMVKGKTSKSLPITVMLSINTSVEAAETVLSSVQGLKPIIRVVGITHTTSNSDIDAFTSVLANDRVSSLIPEGTLVVFGNELNNLDHEYGICPGEGGSGGCPDQLTTAGQKYRAQYQHFISADTTRYVPVPAPPDMYNGNYDWKTFTDAAGVYGGTLVANVYSQNLELWKQLPGNVVAFTEYGPDPSSATLQEHIDFFAQNPPPVPATTLIPDRCRSTNHTDDLWLFYIDGKIYDEAGIEVDPTNCSSGIGEPPEGDYYSRFIFPFYYDDPTKTTSLQEELEERLLSDYTASCVQPADYETFLGGSGSISELFNQQGYCKAADGDKCLFSPEASLMLTSNGLQNMFGVLRNEQSARWRAYEKSQPDNASKRSFISRFESVEQWFGAKNPEEDPYIGTTPKEIKETHQGPFFKLASAEMQCSAAAEIMKATYELCQDWEVANPELVADGKPCPLDKPISGTRFTMGTLSSELTTKLSTSDPTRHPGQIACDEYYPLDLQNPQTQVLEPYIKAMGKIDLYMETAYRPAFLVMVTEVDPPNSVTGPGNTKATIIANDGDTTNTKHIVDYLVYHVPATLTDINKSNDYAHSDIVTRTVETFTSEDIITSRNEKDATLRANVTESVKRSKDPTAGLALAVECAREECAEPLRRALINYINGANMALGEDLKCESGEARNQDRVEVGKTIGSRLGPIDETQPAMQKDEGTVDVRINQYYDRNGNAVDTKPFRTKIYNISPFGTNTDFASRQLDSLLTVKQQEEEFSQKEGYYSTFGAPLGQSFSQSEDVSSGYDAVLDGKTVRIPVTGGIKLKNEGTPFSIQFRKMGKIFNNSTRAITQLVVGWGTKTWNCAKDVSNPETNTEDFLKNCQRGNTGTTPSPDENTDDYLATEVVSTNDCRTVSVGRIGAGPTNISYTGDVCKASEAPAANVGNPAFVYTSSLNIENWRNGNDDIVCDELLYKYVVCTNGPGNTEDNLTRQGSAPALIAHMVDENGNFTESGTKTACQYVVDQAKASGVSPRLALAMWGEESGFSAFPETEDFGVISTGTSRQLGSIKNQLDGFLGTIDSYGSYLGFLRAYSGEKTANLNNFCNNPNFPARLHTFYNYFSKF